MAESAEGVVCYVIGMKYKGYTDLERACVLPAFFKTFHGQGLHNGRITTGSITEANRFPTEAAAMTVVRLLLLNPTVCNDTQNSYEISVCQLKCGVSKSARLAANGYQIELY